MFVKLPTLHYQESPAGIQVLDEEQLVLSEQQGSSEERGQRSVWSRTRAAPEKCLVRPGGCANRTAADQIGVQATNSKRQTKQIGGGARQSSGRRVRGDGGVAGQTDSRSDRGRTGPIWPDQSRRGGEQGPISVDPIEADGEGDGAGDELWRRDNNGDGPRKISTEVASVREKP
jgi:hypothetical protein